MNTSLEGSKNNRVTSLNSLISANRRQTNTNVCIIQKPCFKPKLSYIYYKIKKLVMHLLRCYVTSSLGQVVEKEQELCLPQKKKKMFIKKEQELSIKSRRSGPRILQSKSVALFVDTREKQ